MADRLHGFQTYSVNSFTLRAKSGLFWKKIDGQQEKLNGAFGSFSARTGRSINQKSYALTGGFRP